MRGAALLVAMGLVVACSTTPDTSTCVQGTTACGSTCVDLHESHSSCGACGVTCSAGQVCDRGTCAADCGGGTIRCGDACYDPRIDPRNCGACGAACPQGEACVQGVCGSTCADHQSVCFNDKGPFCASLHSDNYNCGQCGHACPYWQVCADGVCADTCAGDQTACVGSNGPFCASTMSDNANCGSCGYTCWLLSTCKEGWCQSTCGKDQWACDGACRSVKVDPDYCGSCFDKCGVGGVCVDGSCACLGSNTLCQPNNQCVDLHNDNANCGTCGAVCSGTCSLGRCVSLVGKNFNGPSGLVSDGTYLYIAGTWNPFQVTRIPVGGGAPVDATGGYAFKGFANGLQTDGKNLYFSDDAYVTTVFCSVPLGGGPTTVLSTVPDHTSPFAIDSTNLYARAVNDIYQAPLAGGPAKKLMPADGMWTSQVTITSDGVNVVWARFAGGAAGLVAVPVGGGASTQLTLHSGLGSLVASPLDGFIYFSYPFSRIKSDGSTLTTLSVDAGDSLTTAPNGEVYELGYFGLYRGTTQLLDFKSNPGWEGGIRIAVDGNSIYWIAQNGDLLRAPR